MSVGTPGSGVRYYRIDYDATYYWSLAERWTATLTARFGIGGAYDADLPSLPLFLRRRQRVLRGDTVFADLAGAPVDYGFDAAALRQSIGLVARFQIPFGTLSLSYALPLDERRRPMSPYTDDDIEKLQLTVRAEF